MSRERGRRGLIVVALVLLAVLMALDLSRDASVIRRAVVGPPPTPRERVDDMIERATGSQLPKP